jgi:hypothetical protein
MSVKFTGLNEHVCHSLQEADSDTQCQLANLLLVCSAASQWLANTVVITSAVCERGAFSCDCACVTVLVQSGHGARCYTRQCLLARTPAVDATKLGFRNELLPGSSSAAAEKGSS